MAGRIKKIDSVKFYHTDPKIILNDINSIPELYYLANLTTLNSRNKVNPEVPLLIGYDAYSKLIDYYSGTTLYIPTREELQSNLLGVMSYYYYDIKGLSWTDTMKKLGLTATKGSRRLLRNRWTSFKNTLEHAEGKVPDFGNQTAKDDAPIKSSQKAPIYCDGIYVPADIFIKVVNTISSDLVENDVIAQHVGSTISEYYDPTD